ncbi:uncharacterized protein B0I36DRAFT_325237 [Microdochium trichocladiopsis]|uniref:P-loop containing nucleoside triphosphate hydrolase protein n=1 Tax=Microdochium trichocladiopsis TaxID=1682393 RepID=A0A9P8Y6Y6_9PEZI|nr:uncharacterized protein B0I36DRAFT_325237 [Microdochium trichocladiopsis]KAH7029197.1 hypothetical protein B0I36DRAFT_325237 [Microdochium trichocladiopsis]
MAATQQPQPAAPPPGAKPGLTVINAGPFKTGTASMAEAYRILGLRPHHGLELMDLPEHWAVLERAAERTWPDAPGVRPQTTTTSSPPSSSSSSAPDSSPQEQRQLLTRAEWDTIFADFDAVTDVAALFADQLSQAYPEAKVVIVRRDTEKWYASFDSQIIQVIWSPFGTFMQHGPARLAGNRGIDAMKKMCYGHWRARTAEELRSNAREGYERYYDRIREVVPPERRLEYQLGSGWAPLCEFLGREVPDVEFPRLNGKDAHSAKQLEHTYDMLGKAGRILAPWVGAAAVLVVGVLVAKRNNML